MIYRCSNCGKKYTKDFEECPSCGGWMYIDDDTYERCDKSKQKQGGSIWLNIISFFMPVLGFVLYGVHIKSSPGIAKGCIKSAITGMCVIIVFYFVLLMGFIMLPNTMNEIFGTEQVKQELSDKYDVSETDTYKPESNNSQPNKWLQEFNNGDIQVKQAFLCPKYSEEAGKNLWEYTIVVEAKCKVKTDMYIHVFDDYKEHLNSQSITQKIDGSGWYTLSGTIYGTETWWYPDIYYFALSDSDRFYDPDVMHMVSYNYDHPSAKNNQ